LLIPFYSLVSCLPPFTPNSPAWAPPSPTGPAPAPQPGHSVCSLHNLDTVSSKSCPRNAVCPRASASLPHGAASDPRQGFSMCGLGVPWAQQGLTHPMFVEQVNFYRCARLCINGKTIRYSIWLSLSWSVKRYKKEGEVLLDTRPMRAALLIVPLTHQTFMPHCLQRGQGVQQGETPSRH
jgi:hypothetical protein